MNNFEPAATLAAFLAAYQPERRALGNSDHALAITCERGTVLIQNAYRCLPTDADRTVRVRIFDARGGLISEQKRRSWLQASALVNKATHGAIGARIA